MIWQLCFLFLCINIASADKFIHLFGYNLLGSTLKTYTEVSDPKQCAANCVNIDANCTGFQMIWKSQECVLLNNIRNYQYSLDECQFFIRNDSTIGGNGLSAMDALIMSNLYATYESCPVGWTPSGNTCVFSTTQTDCDQYLSYLGANYSDTGMCVIPAVNGTWVCPTASQYGPTVMPDGVYYCYLFLTYTYSTSNPTYKLPASACNAKGFTLASIHSATENSLIQSKAPAAIIGYITTTTVTASAFSWVDGTANDYNKWGSSQPSGSPFLFTASLYGSWMVISTESSAKAITRTACKAEATWTIS